MSKEYNENKMIDGELLFNELLHRVKMMKRHLGNRGWDEMSEGVCLLSIFVSNLISILSLGYENNGDWEKYETIENDEYPEWSRDLMKRMNQEFRQEDWRNLDELELEEDRKMTYEGLRDRKNQMD